MPNYQETKIYKIYSAINDDIYIGSTALKLCERMRDHRTRHRTQAYTHLPLYKAFAEHGKDNFYIELIENALVMTRTRHTKKEGEWTINLKPPLNMHIPGRTKQEYQ